MSVVAVDSSVVDSLDGLLQHSGDLVVSWNLDQFVAPILRHLPVSVLSRLSSSTSRGRSFWRPYSIVYNRGKTFSVECGRRHVTVYGLDQYYPDDEPDPEDVGELMLRTNRLMGLLEQALGFVPRSLASPVSAYADRVLPNLHLATIADVPKESFECAKYALACTDRQWVSNYRIGHWDTGSAYSYDISAAYPSDAMEMVDFRGGRFVKSSQILDSAHYGYLYGAVTINKPVSPVMAELKDGWQVNFVGTRDMFITRDEVEHIVGLGIGDFRMKDGWFVYGGSYRPLRQTMADLYRARGQDDLSDRFVKRVANGLIGKFLETRRDGLGDYYNPIWHAAITSRTRIRVSEFINYYELEDRLIHVGTDGVWTTGSVPLFSGRKKGADGNGMGQWRASGSEPLFVLSPGLVFSGRKHPKGIYHDRLMSMIAEHPRSRTYRTAIPRRVTLGEALERGDVSRVGELQDFYSTVDLPTLHLNQDRVFPEMPEFGQDLLNRKYKSEPIRA